MKSKNMKRKDHDMVKKTASSQTNTGNHVHKNYPI